MSFFSYNFLDRTRKSEIGSFSENFSKKGYEWEDVKKQINGSVAEKPTEQAKPVQEQNSLNRENSWSFFNNPHSEWEQKRKNLVDEYRREMQAKFQEKVERDKRPKFVEKREFYNSASYQEKQFEESRPSNTYSHNVNMNSSIEIAKPSEKFEYYSPQLPKKFNQSVSQYQNPYPQNSSPNHSPSLYQDRNSYANPYQNPRKTIEKPAEPFYEHSKANMTSDQNKIIREKQLEEWRKSVQIQLEERNKLKEEQKSRKLLEDKLEEAKIKREVEELNKKYQQEIRYETGLPVEEKFESKPRAPPKFEEREVMPVRPVIKQQSKPLLKPKEDYRIKHDLVLQEAGIKDVILKIKLEANHAAAERQEILNELERMKAELRNTRLYDPFRDNYNYYQQFRPQDKKIVSLTHAGKNIVNSSWKNLDELSGQSKYLVKKNKNFYEEVESLEAKNQLNRLDDIIMAQIDEKHSDEEKDKDKYVEEEIVQKEIEEIKESNEEKLNTEKIDDKEDNAENKFFATELVETSDNI